MDVWRNKFFEMELQFSISAGEMKKVIMIIIIID